MNNFSATISQMQAQAAAKKGPPPPIPKRIGVPGGARMAVALYDYDAQQAGDLSFRKDDRIEIVERSNSTNEWWTGRLHGKQGLFPGNYVQEL
jgi:amphiphysin